MKLGFTGTRHSLTNSQHAAIQRLLPTLRPDEAHHGDCVGADEAFHRICRTLAIPVVIHPPKEPKLRAWCDSTLMRPAAPYLSRNRQIVKDTQALIAAPKETAEPEPAQGQGTWSTVRYARRSGTPVYLIWPDGRVERQGHRTNR